MKSLYICRDYRLCFLRLNFQIINTGSWILLWQRTRISVLDAGGSNNSCIPWPVAKYPGLWRANSAGKTFRTERALRRFCHDYSKRHPFPDVRHESRIQQGSYWSSNVFWAYGRWTADWSLRWHVGGMVHKSELYDPSSMLKAVSE